jgi:hypothetical protein
MVYIGCAGPLGLKCPKSSLASSIQWALSASDLPTE